MNNYGERVTGGVVKRIGRQFRKIRKTRDKTLVIRNTFHLIWQLYGSLEIAPRPSR